ncbi:MAG TPA: DUF805 domain-containing protein [Burkholderiales bacterium]|nr:DUF805 domain-containing protein [Burkholderiales bacterium]
MQEQNPYTAPKANVGVPAAEFGKIRLLSARGRLGRVRYIGYSFGLPMLIGLAIGAVGVALTAAGDGMAAPLVALVGNLILVIVYALLSIQRAHDFNVTGWAAILAFIPLVNFVFWFIPGTESENRFGLRPPPNTVGAIVLACIVPLIFVIGIVAAIAIPSYQQYVERAKAEAR